MRFRGISRKEFYMGTKKKILSFLLIIPVLLFISGCAQQFKSPMFQSNDYSGHGPNGLTWNGRDLVMGDGKLIMEINSIETGPYISEKSKFNSEGFSKFARDPEPVKGALKDLKISGLTWEGECCGKGFLWVADEADKEILKLDAYNNVLKRFPSPGDTPSGLAFDGKDLWVSDSSESKIYKISTENGTVLAEYNSPVKVPTDLAWDCENIWILGLDQCKNVTRACYVPRLLKLDVKSAKVTEEIELPKQIVRPVSIVWVDGVMWIGDYELNRIFRVPVSPQKVYDDTVYATAITYKPRKIAIKEMPEEEIKEEVKLEETKPLTEEARKAAEEARKAAEEAKEAAKKAEEAAKKSEKAFELQQKK